jgi:hypothetical protein
MKTRIVLLALGLLGVSSGDVAAQTPARSFGDLSDTVKPGMTVVVDLADGGSAGGKVVSLSGDRIEIRRRRWNWRSEQLTLVAASVRRIDHRDSTVNGELLGFGAGALAAWVRCKTGGPPSGLDMGCLGWSLFAPIGGGIAGHVIDRNHRRPLYVAPGVVGVAASIGF